MGGRVRAAHSTIRDSNVRRTIDASKQHTKSPTRPVPPPQAHAPHQPSSHTNPTQHAADQAHAHPAPPIRSHPAPDRPSPSRFGRPCPAATQPVPPPPSATPAPDPPHRTAARARPTAHSPIKSRRRRAPHPAHAAQPDRPQRAHPDRSRSVPDAPSPDHCGPSAIPARPHPQTSPPDTPATAHPEPHRRPLHSHIRPASPYASRRETPRRMGGRVLAAHSTGRDSNVRRTIDASKQHTKSPTRPVPPPPAHAPHQPRQPHKPHTHTQPIKRTLTQRRRSDPIPRQAVPRVRSALPRHCPARPTAPICHTSPDPPHPTTARARPTAHSPIKSRRARRASAPCRAA
jgi:hypothetical protein